MTYVLYIPTQDLYVLPSTLHSKCSCSFHKKKHITIMIMIIIIDHQLPDCAIGTLYILRKENSYDEVTIQTYCVCTFRGD